VAMRLSHQPLGFTIMGNVMTLNTNTLATEIISTICAGLFLAAAIGISVRIIQLVSRKYYFPIKLHFLSSAVYGAYSGSYAVVPSNTLIKLNGKNVFLNSLNFDESSYICPIPFVIQLTNISDKKNPREFHLKEVEIIIKGSKIEDKYFLDKSLIKAEQTCQAGGRGSEATFRIYIPLKEEIHLSLFRSLMKDNHDFRFGLDLHADSYNEVCFWIFPFSVGRYVFDVFVYIEELGRNHKIRVAHNIALLKLDNMKWVNELFYVTELWYYPTKEDRQIEEEYRKGLIESINDFIKLFHRDNDEPLTKNTIQIFGNIVERM
jgi:hypothetical protein